MNCPYCGFADSRVVETRDGKKESVTRRRRECKDCEERFTTYERVEPPSITVVKRDGSEEQFDRSKIRAGFERACKKRPIGDADIGDAVDEIESDIKSRGQSTIDSSTIGDLVSDKLKEMDQVAYLRFASIYNEFDDVSSFEEEAKTLRTDSE